MKDTRVEFRSSPQEKDLLMLASQLMGVNVSVFLRKAAIDAANQVVQEHESLKLSNRDRDLFLKTLDTPPAPSSKLKNAMEKYKRAQRD